jgi:putative hydrolase of the HAD superfamily
MQNVKNIIFDLGGVILNIDLKRTELALQELGIDQFSNYMTQSSVISFFKDYEAGKIDDDAFIKAIQALTVKSTTEAEIIKAWNALLLDFPPKRIELLQNLKKKYRLFLLSNTNSIHYRQFQQQLYLQTGGYLEDIFEKTYYSHTINIRKPDLASFQFVINENKLDPAETLFVDDSEANIAAAKEAGLSVVHIIPGKSILDIEW